MRRMTWRTIHTHYSETMNKAILIGNVGNDPEIRSTTGGQNVATLSLATSRKWKDQSGEQQERTQWHRLVVWGKLSDVVERYVKKGDKLAVVGEIEYRQWEDKDGQTRYTTEINVRELEMLGSPRGSSDDAPAKPSGRKASVAVPDEDDDDSLPF